MTTHPSDRSRRLRSALHVAIAAVVATVSLTSCADSDPAPGPEAITSVADSSNPAASEPSESPTATPSTDPVDPDLAALLDEDPQQFVGPGTEVRTMNARVSIRGDELVVIERGDTERRAALVDTYGVTGVYPVEQQLGQAGTGYLVDTGDGENSPYALFVGNHDGVLTAATVTGGVPFGTGTSYGRHGRGYYTYSADNGVSLFTRVQLGGPDSDRYTVYRWQVPGPGEGGGGPPPPLNLKIELVPTKIGVFCLDFLHDTGKRC